MLSATGDQDDDQLKKVVEKMNDVPGVCDITFGKTHTTEYARYFTHALVVRFLDRNQIKGYYEHQRHVDVIDYFGKFLNEKGEKTENDEKKVVVDFDAIRKGSEKK